MNFSVRHHVQLVGVLMGMAACALPAQAQFNTTGAGTFAFGSPGNWVGNVINGVFAQDNSAGAQTITFASTDSILSFGLTFDLRSANPLSLEADGGPYTMVLGGNVSMASPSGGVATIGSSVAASALNINLNGARTFTVAANNTIVLPNTISGLLGLTKAGAGTVELTGANTYTGGTTVTGGTLQIGDFTNGFEGSVVGDARNGIVVSSGAVVNFSPATSTRYSGVISGGGEVTKSGAAVLELAASSTYSGITTIRGGTLKVGETNALPVSTSISLASGTTLDVSNSQTIAGFVKSVGSSILLATGQVLQVDLDHATSGTVFSGIMSGGGGLRIGSNTGHGQWVTLTEDNTFTGGTRIDSGGSLQLGIGGTTGLIGGDVVDNGALNFQRSLDTTFDGIISGSGSVSLGAVAGTSPQGFLNLTGANTYAGGTQVYRGKFFASNVTGSATGTGTVTVQANGLVAGTGTISGPLNVSLGGVVAPMSDAFVPSTLHVGDTMFGGAGRFGFGIVNANGIAGTDFSLLSISGRLSITATASSPFEVEIHSVNLAGVQAPLPNFDSSQSYSWMFLTATGGINGFNSAFFLVDTKAFGSAFTGSFSVKQSADSLLLQYAPTAVPEPATWVLLALGMGIVAVVSWRNRIHHRAVTGDHV